VTIELPDTEGAVRAYLRSHTDVAAVVGQRVFFGIPGTPTYPLAVVARVGGFEDSSDAPIDQALIQVDCIGSLHDDTRNSPDKAEANRVRLAVRQAFLDLTHTHADVEVADTVVRLSGAVVQSDPYLPDPGDGRPKYPITVQLTAHQLIPTP
jgi:hypothetical protein